MSAHVLLNLLNNLRKSDKCEACQVSYSFSVIRNEKVLLSTHNKRKKLRIRHYS